jgi:hypothetical protein
MPVNDIRAALEAIQQPGGEPVPDDTQLAHARLTEAAEIYEDPSQRPRAEKLLAEAKRELETIGNDDALRHVGKAIKGLRR